MTLARVYILGSPTFKTACNVNSWHVFAVAVKACGSLCEDVKTVVQTVQTESHIESPNIAESSR